MTDLAQRLQQAIATIVRIQKIMEPEMQTADGALKLAPSDIQAMRYIAQNPDCMSGAVAGFLGVVPTTMSSIVDRLVQRGFVTRQRPAENRRAVALRLTEEGADVFQQLETEELTASQRMLDALPRAERPDFVRMIGTIAQALSKLEDQPSSSRDS